MGSKQIDYTGAHVGPFFVNKKVQSSVYGRCKKRAWECVCFCGTVKVLTTQELQKHKSCGCQKASVSVSNSINSRWKVKKEDCQEWANRRMYKVYQRNASARNVSFELTEDEASSLFLQNCFYCNAPPSNGGKKTSFKTQGIDRLDNDEGYRLDNVVPCCAVCNHAKHTMGYLEFIIWIQRVFNHMRL